MENELPKRKEMRESRKITLNIGWYKRNSKAIILLVLCILMLLSLYSLTFWGYRSSRFPYSFDNFVQKYGLWRIYGKKTYQPLQTGTLTYAVDPRITEAAYTYEGFVLEGNVSDISVDEQGVVDHLTISRTDEDSYTIPGPFTVDLVEKLVRIDETADATSYVISTSIEEVQPGSIIQIIFLKNDGESKVAKITMRDF